MAFFSRKPKWIETFRLQCQPGTGRNFLTVLFWLWGGGGLALAGATLAGLNGSVGVGTSAYIAAMCLVWIGGMVLFGLGALLADGDFSAVKPAEEPSVGNIRITR